MESSRAALLSRSDEILCDACAEDLPPFIRAAAFGDYGGSLRSLIHLHKFDGVRALSKPLGERLATAIHHACDGSAGPVYVVAVPLFRGKRAFNQSELLATWALRHLSSTGSPTLFVLQHGLLRRNRRTESQSHLTPHQRRENVRGAFSVQQDARGLDVLLIDDVYTTGATARECTRVLLQAGAATVRVATLARTQRGLATTWDAGVAAWPTPFTAISRHGTELTP